MRDSANKDQTSNFDITDGSRTLTFLKDGYKFGDWIPEEKAPLSFSAFFLGLLLGAGFVLSIVIFGH